MANSFMKKDQQLKNTIKNKSVNSKVEEMAKRASIVVEKKSEADEVKEEPKKELSSNIEVDKPNTKKIEKIHMYSI